MKSLSANSVLAMDDQGKIVAMGKSQFGIRISHDNFIQVVPDSSSKEQAGWLSGDGKLALLPE